MSHPQWQLEQPPMIGQIDAMEMKSWIDRLWKTKHPDAFYAHLNGVDYPLIGTGSARTIPFSHTKYNYYDAYSPTTFVFNPKFPGLYYIYLQGQLNDAPVGNGMCQLWIEFNYATTIGMAQVFHLAGGYVGNTFNTSTIQYFNGTTDFVAFRCNNATGGTLDLNGLDYYTYAFGHKIG